MSAGDLKALGEELGAALFAWYRARGQTGHADAIDVQLYQVVGRTFMPYYPASTPRTEVRPWSRIPAGWEVQAPSGEWYEVLATVDEGKTGARVTIARDGVEVGTWTRPAADQVTCRPGARASREIAEGMAILGEGATIKEDRVPE